MPQLLQNIRVSLSKSRNGSVNDTNLNLKNYRQHSAQQLMATKTAGWTTTVNVNTRTAVIDMSSANEANQSQFQSATSQTQFAERKLARTRQSAGYTCDRCREKRVRCNREKPVCSRCQTKGAECHYSGRMRMYDKHRSEAQVQKLRKELYKISMSLDEMEPQLNKKDTPLDISSNTKPLSTKPSNVLSIQELVRIAGWNLIEGYDNSMTIETNIRLLDDLRSALLKLLKTMYSRAGLPLRSYPSKPLIPRAFPVVADNLEQKKRASQHRSMVVFDQLSRYTDIISLEDAVNNGMDVLDSTTMQGILMTYADCGFPLLVSSSLAAETCNMFMSSENRALKASVYCTSIFHGTKFHNHGHVDADQIAKVLFPTAYEFDLGDPNIGMIWQLLHLVSHDLDYGNIQKAYLNIGTLARICFALDLHRPCGYLKYYDILSKEQVKRAFWCVWLFDSLVPQFFGLPDVINPEEIKIDVPLIVDGMDTHDAERTVFIQQIISSRMVSRKITQAITGMVSNDEAYILSVVTNMEHIIRGHYNSLPTWIPQEIGSKNNSDTMWRRRTKFCTLIEACTNWICLYQSYLPNGSSSDRLSNLEKLALNRCIESAKTLQDLFINWLSLMPKETDCMFRPYLYHYMTTIDIYKYLAVSSQVDPAIRNSSRQSLVRLLELYRQTPLYHARKVSKLEADLLRFLHSISVHV